MMYILLNVYFIPFFNFLRSAYKKYIILKKSSIFILMETPALAIYNAFFKVCIHFLKDGTWDQNITNLYCRSQGIDKIPLMNIRDYRLNVCFYNAADTVFYTNVYINKFNHLISSFILSRMWSFYHYKTNEF